MPNAYADLATLKSPSVLNVPDDTHDERLLGLLEAASRWIDGYCGRHFASLHGEHRFDGTGKTSLTVPDLVRASELRVREPGGEWVAWPAADWLLYPLNAAPTTPGGRPYTRILLASGTRRCFPLNRAGVSVTGVWGYGDVRGDAGLQVGGNAGLAADARTVAAAGNDPAATIALSAGHTIRIGDEQLYVVGAAPGEPGSLSLTVQRGVNGTTVAAHAVGSALSVYRYPDGVAEACLAQAAEWWRDRQGGPFRPPDPDGCAADGISDAARALLAPYRRRHATLGV